MYIHEIKIIINKENNSICKVVGCGNLAKIKSIRYLNVCWGEKKVNFTKVKKKKKLFLNGKGENESQIKYKVGKKESQGKFYLV